jgi:WD40 repeat protein
MPVGLGDLRFKHYQNILCDMTSSGGGVSEKFRRAVREACQPSLRFVQGAVWTGHSRPVRSVSFAPDGTLLATADEHTIRLWDTQTGGGRVLVVGGLEPAWPVTITGDGRIAAAARHLPGVHTWNPATGALIRSLGKHEQIRSISFSGNGEWLATGGDDHSARVWSAVNGKPVARLAAGSMLPAWPMAFSPDSSSLAVANFGSDSVTVWSAGAWLKWHRTTRPSRAKALCWSPESTMVISGGTGGDIQIHSAKDGEVLRVLEPHTGQVNAVDSSPNGRVFASAGNDGTIKIVGTITGEVVQTLTLHEGPVYAVAFSPDGLTLVSAGADKVVRLWRRTSETPS